MRRNLFIITIMLCALCIVAAFSIARAAPESLNLSPSAPFDRFLVTETLVLFWIAVIGLIVIIRMKLKEIERIQRMAIDREEKDAPFLD